MYIVGLTRLNSNCAPPHVMEPSNPDGVAAQLLLDTAPGSIFWLLVRQITQAAGADLGNGVTAQQAVRDAAAGVRPGSENLWATAQRVSKELGVDQPVFQAICDLAGATYNKGLKKHPGTIAAIKVRLVGGLSGSIRVSTVEWRAVPSGGL